MHNFQYDLMSMARWLLLTLLLVSGSSDAAEIYGAGYVCDEANSVFRLGYTQKITASGYDRDYSSNFTSVFGAGLSKVQCDLTGASVVATVLVTPPVERTICGGAPSLLLKELLVNGRPALTQAVIDSHCRAGYALLGVGISGERAASDPKAHRTTIETVWARNTPTPFVQREGRFLEVTDNNVRHSLAPWDPDFRQPDPGISEAQMANLVKSVDGACSAVLSLYDAHDWATLAPTKLVGAALQRAGLRVDRVTASVDTEPAHALQFQFADDATLSWHGELLPQPMLSAANNSWVYLPASKFTGWDSVVFQVYLNERPAFRFTYRVFVVDRNSAHNVAACPENVERDSRP